MSTNTDFWGKDLYLKSPIYDWFWFILSPLWAVAIGWIMTAWLFQKTVTIFHTTETTAFFIYMSITQAHLLITAFRTHANSELLERYFWRFTLVPIVLFFAALSSSWMFTAMFVVMVFWDLYHSSMQIFGFARIYDRKAGNDPNEGRLADFLLCFMMYVGPVFAGALFLSHVAAFDSFNDVSHLDLFGILITGEQLARVPDAARSYQSEVRWAMIAVSLAVVAYYFWTLHRLSAKGYKIPIAKVAMFLTTAVGCVTAWGFNSFAMGYLIANLFHAVQYFALLWVLEDKSIARVFNFSFLPKLALYLTIPLCFGLVLVAYDSLEMKALLMVCAFMHFWWDGFIWS
ncbi:MAG: hypothetical protein HOE54_14350, partial [Gammaproteobacteria bacterium]|nr:hypothetical protein [Gammaproteobacteria bacterium]